MKSIDLLVLAGAGALAWYLVRRAGAPALAPAAPGAVRGGGNPAAPDQPGSIFVRDVLNPAMPGQPGWGWRYYDNGTAIGPDGAYYLNGVKVWEPAGNGAGASGEW